MNPPHHSLRRTSLAFQPAYCTHSLYFLAARPHSRQALINTKIINPFFIGHQTMLSNAASSMTSTPKLSALVNLPPAPGPATSTLVLALTEPETFAPSTLNFSNASSRVIDSNVPVKTQVWPEDPVHFEAHWRLRQATGRPNRSTLE